MDCNDAVVIRERQPLDIAPLSDVLVTVHESDGYPVEGVADPVGWLESAANVRAWTAIKDNEPVGHVALAAPQPGDEAPRLLNAKDGTELHAILVLGRLFVSHSARGHSLGRRLTQIATEHAENMGKRAVLDVMAKDNAAIRTYEALGWIRLGTFQHHVEGKNAVPAAAYAAPQRTRATNT